MIDLNQVLREQQVEAQELRRFWKERERTSEFKEMILSSGLVKVVTGIRRSGKSTLCLGSIPSDYPFSYVNFDDERLVGLKTEDLNKVYETLLQIQPETKIFIFDEIQNIESWELFANRLQRKKINLIITGSNGKLLSQELATHLTGRHLSLELSPLSYREFLKFNNLEVSETMTTEERALVKNKMQTYFEIGGFPEVVLGEPGGPYLRELFDKIITRDIAQRHRLRNTRILKEIALYLVQQSGSMTSLANLEETFQINSINTLRSYFQYLQEVFLLYEVQGYSGKLKERTTRPRKYYVCDLGMWSALNTKPTLDLGMRLETLIYLHLSRSFPHVYYLKEPGFDIDFCVVKERTPTLLIQVCYSIQNSATRTREIRSLVSAAKQYRMKSGTIVTWDDEDSLVEEGIEIRIVPAWKFLLSV